MRVFVFAAVMCCAKAYLLGGMPLKNTVPSVRSETLYSSCIKKKLAGLCASMSDKDAAAPLGKDASAAPLQRHSADRRYLKTPPSEWNLMFSFNMFINRRFGLALMNILLATTPLMSFTKDASAEERELPGRWAFRARGSVFDAGFGEDFTQLESGLRFKDVKDGDGKEIVEGMGVKINFVGYILGDGKKFDSTWDKGRYVSFKARIRF
jgi:hypothetical protein